ncbi:MAG: bifunctional hydroxymethylpyrimidine kinase/phosphomethylpyrimidine kinase [Elusimicrobiales bacterium]|nr:bifunctional hydroxymethylpyrimidine kinase/phosphomethylpyrimidine kinase [Elusimicrobiales bacterium]
MIPRVLTIAGSDPGGGAGIQGDLKTFGAFRVYGLSVITAVTVQNTLGVRGVNPVAPRLVAAQAEAVLADIGADAVKIGMLASSAIVKAAAGCLKKYAIKKIVLDPVMLAKDGSALLAVNAVSALIKEMLPLALMVTPNAPEAARLAGIKVETRADARRAAKIISGFGPRFVLVKGGHLPGKVCRDLLFDGREFTEFSSPRLATPNTHGTGCALSAAIAACLALGLEPRAAVKEAGLYLAGALRGSFSLGGGCGPLNHFWRRG